MKVFFNGKDITGNNTIYFDNKKIQSTPSVSFHSYKKVNDEVRGYLIHKMTGWFFVSPHKYNLIKNERKKKVKQIALILESPHDKEYDKNYQPIRPANGPTGLRIKNSICKYSHKWRLSKNCDYEVKLFNAVRYQCSCYHDILKPNRIRKIDKSLRDSVFDVLFSKLTIKGKNSLVYRIEKYRPKIIVNACTNGKIIALSDLVEKEIKNSSLSSIRYYSAPHPSSYWWGISGI